jgi:hypothetical protein
MTQEPLSEELLPKKAMAIISMVIALFIKMEV